MFYTKEKIVQLAEKLFVDAFNNPENVDIEDEALANMCLDAAEEFAACAHEYEPPRTM